MLHIDRIAILLCLCSMIAYAVIANQVFENIPHLEDEYTLVWQAKAAARDQMLVPTPPSHDSFLVPFVIDAGGYRFGKYPPGFPVLLSFGIRLGARDWVNPFIAACSLWLIYRLAKRLLDERTALVAAFLTATSPFFVVNAANLLTHVWSLFLTVSFTLAWLETFHFQSKVPRWLTVAVAGGSLGVLALTRPWTAVGVTIPFALHGLYLLWKGGPPVRRWLFGVGALAGSIASLHFLWQFTLTGSPWTNPYTLWWPYDALGLGPGIGVGADGHTLRAGLSDALHSLNLGTHDFLGWPWLSWLFLPFGLLAARRNWPVWLLVSVFLSLVLVYMLYWVPAWVFGPRYYFEALHAWTIVSAAGISWIARQVVRFQRTLTRAMGQASGSDRPRTWLRLVSVLIPRLPAFIFALVLALLITGNLLFYLPDRLNALKRLYDTDSSLFVNFQTPQAIARTPALVIVHAHGNWRKYGAFLELFDPFLDSPFIFAFSINKIVDEILASDFPDRQVIHYYPERPDQFFLKPLE